MKKVIFLFLTVILVGQNINKANAYDAEKGPRVVSSINPIYQIVNFIMGDDKNDTLLINPRISVHNYQFRPSDVSAVNNADVVFYISDDLENNLSQLISKAQNQPKIVPLIKTNGLKLLSFQVRVGEVNTDPHIWLNPDNAILMAAQISYTLSQISPENAKTYQKNLEQFIMDVKNMDQKNRLQLIKVRQKSFLVYHNSTSYFEDYYKITAGGVMTYYHNQELTLDDLHRINDLIKKNHISCIISTPQEGNNIAIQTAMNNKIKFALADVIGNQANYKQNGYVKLITNFVDGLVKCVNN